MRVSLIALAICGLVFASAAAADPPNALLTRALTTAKTQHSVHYVSEAVGPTVRVRMVGDAARDRGIQRITYTKNGRTGEVTVEVVADTAYVRGDAFTLENYMGFPATSAAKYAHKWITLAHTAAGYSTVAAGVRLASTVDEIRATLKPPLRTVAATVVGGQHVVGVRSVEHKTAGALTETVYITASAPQLPVEDLATQGARRLLTIFSRWNEPVDVRAPAAPLPTA